MDKILSERIYKDSKTIAIMDEFESKDEDGSKKYHTLLLSDIFCIKYRYKLYSISLYVQTMTKKTEHISSSLTFTDLKQSLLEHVFETKNKKNCKVVNEVFAGISKVYLQCEKETIYTFPVPVQFNAQNSSNRSGYGNRYCGEDLVYEGTLYGETTDYMFVGARYRRW